MAEVSEDRRASAGTPEKGKPGEERIRDRRALALLLSLILFLLLVPILEKSALGGLVLIVSLYATLVAAFLHLATYTAKRWWILPTLLLAGTSMAFILLSHFVPTRPLVATSQCLLMLFFGLIACGFFIGLGQPGSITKGRLFTSVSLYLILGLFWFAGYTLIETLYPGSFAMVRGATGPISRSSLLYLSYVTLTTVGYGDVLPIAPFARMLAALEAATGVLYVAITIARLVSAYQGSGHRHV
jgi:hypothetical protein